ncbi:MAG: hypothetical protein ACREBR_05055 [bacterium]
MKDNKAQGGFSDEVWNDAYLAEYRENSDWGYFSGNRFRKATFDTIVEATLRAQGFTVQEVAGWITSTEARHFQDQVTKKTTLKEFLDIVLKWGKFSNYIREGR